MAKKKSKPRRIDPTKILADDEVRILAEAVREYMGEPFASLTAERVSAVEDTVRLSPLTRRFQEGREATGLSIKEVASRLKVPQYRLKDIERGSHSIKPEFLYKYASFLELDHWLRRWVKANRELAERMSLTDRPPARAGTLADRRHSAYRFKIRLKEFNPPIWRRIEVPSTYNFWDLHVAIQDAMGWLDCHLHMFKIIEPESGERHFIGIPDEEGLSGIEIEPGWEKNIADYFRKKGDIADYEYDFGDGWLHEVQLEGIVAREKGRSYPRCISGKRACPPEDCGGVGGYYDLLEVMGDPSHPEYGDTMEWLGGNYAPNRFFPSTVRFDDPQKRWQRAFT